jgi:hypothetical protein
MMKKTDAPRRWMAKVRVKFRYSWCIVRLVYYRHLAEIVDRLPLGGLPWLRFCYPVLRPTATSVRWHGFEELRQRRSTASTGLISVTAVVSIAGGWPRLRRHLREDKRHGHGKFSWPDGALYEGEFRNGVREGHGLYLFSDGGTLVLERWPDFGQTARREHEMGCTVSVRPATHHLLNIQHRNDDHAPCFGKETQPELIQRFHCNVAWMVHRQTVSRFLLCRMDRSMFGRRID